MKSNEAGFTIIELMIATVVFTIILIITTTTLIGISQTYIKGSVEGQTQQTARAVLNDISQDIQLNNDVDFGNMATTSNTTDSFYFCIGNDVYAYQLDQVVSSSNWALVRYSGSSGSCSAPTGNPLSIASGQPEELLATNERLGALSITKVTDANGSTIGYSVNLEVAYGVGPIGNSLLNDTTNSQWSPPPATSPNGFGYYQYPYQCSSGLDSSFCAVSTLTTTVSSRITGN